MRIIGGIFDRSHEMNHCLIFDHMLILISYQLSNFSNRNDYQVAITFHLVRVNQIDLSNGAMVHPDLVIYSVKPMK